MMALFGFLLRYRWPLATAAIFLLGWLAGGCACARWHAFTGEVIP